MLKPKKYFNTKLSIFNIGARIIKTLQERKITPINELLDYLTSEIGEGVKEVFLPSIAFLFLLGKISYHRKIDSVELLCD